MTYRLRNIGFAVALAIIAALLVTFYVSNYRRNVQEAEETVRVYVAGEQIPAGTPGSEVLAGGLLKPADVARRNVVPGAISSPDQIKRLVAGGAIYEGEQVTTRRFTTVEEKGIRSQLTGALRAFQLPGDEHQLLAGTLKAGDHIDVVATIKYKVNGVPAWLASELGLDESGVADEQEREASRIVLRDILVLKSASAPSATSKVAGPNADALSVILALTDSQAQKLAFTSQSDSSQWTLQLRPTDDPADSPESVETIESLLADGLKRAQIEQLICGLCGRSTDDLR